MDILTRLQPLIGLVGILSLAYALSTNRRAISLRIVGWGLGLQVLFALIAVKTPVGIEAFKWLGGKITRLLAFSVEGSRFVFGPLGDGAIWKDAMTRVFGPSGEAYDAVERAITPRTRAFIVNSPGNPSGKVFTREEMQALARIATERDLLVFTDEIYEYFLYDGRRHVSMASLPGMAERTITIGGYSKTFSITGWRIGYSVAARQWSQAIGAMNDLLYVCAPTPLQAGVAAGIRELPEAFYRRLAKDYQEKRDRFCAALAQAGLPPAVPQGAYYVLADATQLPGDNGKERAMHLLRKTGVAGVPGEAFFPGPEGSRYIRFSYAKTDTDLDEACRRISRFF